MTHRSHKKEPTKVPHVTKDYAAVAEKMKGVVPSEVTHTHYEGGKATDIRRTLTIRTIPIAIGVPMDELMFSKFFSTYGTLSIMPWDALFTTSSTLVEEARNIIHNIFLEKSKVPYLLMLDSDCLPPPDLIERLLADDKPVVGGWYRKKEKFPVKDLDGSVKIYQRPVVYDFSRYDAEKKRYFYNQRLEPGQGLERVDAMGAGCWLIKREVIEAIGPSPFSLSESGEDMCFCRAVYKAGYSVWCDWDISVGHCGVWWV
jgi:hypothetical protein